MPEQFALNPKSGRYISKSSRLYFKLVNEGIITVEPTPLPEVAEKGQTPCNTPKALKKKLKKVGFEVIAENKSQLEGTHDLNDDELDQLLKRMLYEKLCINEEKTPSKKKKSKPKPKKKKKRIIVPSSSDESDSESSESESD